MSLGDKISQLRKERNLTQTELGNQLGVTYQAVSKWERNDSMPDFDMISKLARFFGVSITYFEKEEKDECDDAATQAEPAEEAAATVQPLGVCTVCGKYVNADTIGVETPKLICKNCLDQQKAQAERTKQAQRIKAESQRQSIAAVFNKRTIIAAVVAGLISITLLIIQLVNINQWHADFNMSKSAYVATSIASFLLIGLWVFQLFFDGVVRSVTLAGMFFIKLPGIIFSADLDGLIFLIVMKVLFFIISAVVFVGAIIVTSLAAMVVSLFTFIPLVIKIACRDDDILEYSLS